jgi:stress-induced-phosphoprotein 1
VIVIWGVFRFVRLTKENKKGMAHHMQKEYYKALEAYEKGMKIDPNYPELVEWTEKTTQAIQRMHTSGGKEEAEAARKARKDEN